MAIFDFWALEPNVWTSFHHRLLNEPHQTPMDLTHLTHTHAINPFRASFSRTPTTVPVKKHTNTHTHTYHCIASVTGQYNDINGWRVVGDTDASILGFIFTVPDKDTERRLWAESVIVSGEAEQCEFTVNRSNRMKKFVLTSNCLVVSSSCCFVVTKPWMSVWKEPVWLVKGEVLRKRLLFFYYHILGGR